MGIGTPIWAQEGVELNSTGDMVADSLAARMFQVQQSLGADGHSHLPLFGGNVWYVDAAQADDTGDGKGPHTAKKTIGAAIALLSVGDAISIKAGTYTEEGLDLNVNSCELWIELGTIIDPASGTALTISGNYCKVRCTNGSLVVSPAVNQIGVVVSGNLCYVQDVRVPCASSAGIGFDVTGSGCVLTNDFCSGALTAAFKVQGDLTILRDCVTGGEVGDSSLGYWITNSADKILLIDCISSGNETAGFQVDAGCTNGLIKDCSSGIGDGDRIDNGESIFWSNFVDRMRRQYHEHAYPFSDGEGAAGAPITVTNSTTDDAAGQRDDQDYWGDPHIIIPPDLITRIWTSLGLYIHAVTISDDQQWQIFFPQARYCSAQNGGNDWDIDETVLTVVDGSIFEVDDLVWLTGTDRPAGEILKVTDVTGNVVTIVSETRMGGGVGIRYDYDGAPGANQICVVHRPGVLLLHGYDGSYSAASAKDAVRYNWTQTKRVDANGGMIMRLLNGTDALATSMEVRAIYVG